MEQEQKSGWWGISVGITILKNCGIKRTVLKKKLSQIIDYIYLDKELD